MSSAIPQPAAGLGRVLMTDRVSACMRGCEWTSTSALSRWAVSALLALTYSYRLLFMEGSLAAKYRWLRKAVDPGWIARRFSG